MTPVTKLRLRLRSAGYTPVPLLIKRPIEKDWQMHTRSVRILKFGTGKPPPQPARTPAG